MKLDAYTTCAYCPRLCRHVCPVAVATGWEAATPTAMMTVPLLHLRGLLDAREATAATSLCLACGACTAHCKNGVPVAELLDAFRAELGGQPDGGREMGDPVEGRHDPGPSATEGAVGPLMFVPCSEGPRPSPDQLACCGRNGDFSEREPAAARAVAEENVRRFAGRPVMCADARCADFLRAHGANVVRAAVREAEVSDDG